MLPFLSNTLQDKFVGHEIYCFLFLLVLVICWKWLMLFVSFLLTISRQMLTISLPGDWNHPFYEILNRPKKAVAFVGLMAFFSSAAVSIFINRPAPSAHDEFSYLLASDTFAHGRLTNPPHPAWESFETMHIIQQPTYASKYPPAQGLFLAFGQRLTGHPIVGVWLSFALMCAALCWMLQAYMAPPWAFFGAFLALIRIGFVGQAYDMGLFGYWSQSYWGGAVAALGGALVFGAVRRLWDKPTVSLSVVLGIGLAILANSRPYEGFLTALPVAGSLFYWYFKKPEIPRRVKVSRVIVPLAAVMLIVTGWIGYYNWRVTGDPLTMPYQVHEKTYAAAPYFRWMKMPPEPIYRNKAIRDFQVGWWKQYYLDQLPFPQFVKASILKVKGIWAFYLGSLLIIPFLVGLFQIRRDPWIKWTAMICVFVLIGMIPITHMPLPHYSAPIMCLLYLMVTIGMKGLYHLPWENGRIGKTAVYTFSAASLLSLYFPLSHGMYSDIPHWSFAKDRQTIADKLKGIDGKHLVIVRYGPEHNVNAEWVYNGADLENAKTVWAREGEDYSRLMKLFSCYPDRIRWLLEADETPPLLQHYSGLPDIMLKKPVNPEGTSKS